MAYHNRLSLEQVASRRVRENKSIGNNIAFRDSVHKTSKEYKSSKNFALTYTLHGKEKGKHASSTESRRLVWEQVVWPLLLEKNRQYFTLQEYRIKSNEFSRTHNIQLPISRRSGGLISLMNKGILKRDKGLYS
ncbi:MAG: hypothetical protein M3146_10350, partial [Thermoproteota archaeon]|nr:hypothetical protein [Thermoproteota archaeon]